MGIGASAELTPKQRADIAASMQKALEEYVLRLAGDAENVCLGGGVAWNALMVSALETSGRFKGVFAQPAAGNAGTALGAALNVWNHVLGEKRRIDGGGYCIGPSFSASEIKQVLENCKLRFRLLATVPETARRGRRPTQRRPHRRLDAGPHGVRPARARQSQHPRLAAGSLFHRKPERHSSSIARPSANSRRPCLLSLPPNISTPEPTRAISPPSAACALPHKEQFRGAILANDLVRVHTVSQDDNPLYWQLLHAFGEKTGLPVLYNTSFNLFGEPLVCTPRDAVRSFYSSGIDAMVVGNFLLEK